MTYARFVESAGDRTASAEHWAVISSSAVSTTGLVVVAGKRRRKLLVVMTAHARESSIIHASRCCG